MIQTSSDSQSKASRNALRHGLSSTIHVPVDKTEQVDQLRLELIRIHQPQSAEERDCISELALARWKTLEFDRQMDLRAQAEFEQAGIIFDRQKLDQFETDEKLWHSSPRFRVQILGQTFHGASLFEQLWSEILNSLHSNLQKITLQQARNMALLLGSSWKIHELSQDGLWLFSRFLKMEPNTAQTIMVWSQSSNTTLYAGDTPFLDHHFFTDSDPATCYKELKDRALKEHRFWMLRKQELMMEYATRRNQFIEMSMGTGLGDPKLANEARLALRYQITAQNRADKLVRRLDGLKRHRNLLEHRAAMAEEREARRLERQALEQATVSGMMGDELDPVVDDPACMAGQSEPESTEHNEPQTNPEEELATTVQNKILEQPIELESRLQDRIDRMMKGRSRSERARIRQQVKAMRREMAATV